MIHAITINVWIPYQNNKKKLIHVFPYLRLSVAVAVASS